MATANKPINKATVVHREKPIKERFDYAVSIIRSLPKDGPFQPSNMVKLKFYGLYKQATTGPNNTPKPGFWDPTSRAKWEAWTLCGDMQSNEAMKMYIRELEETIQTMPQTKEVKDFLKMISPYDEESNSNENPTTSTDTGADEGNTSTVPINTVQQSGVATDDGEKVTTVSDSDEDDMDFQDSYDDLTNTPTTISTTITTSNSSVPPSFSGSLDDSTPSPIGTGSLQTIVSTPSNSNTTPPPPPHTSPSAITPIKDDNQSLHGSTAQHKEVRFSDTVYSLRYTTDEQRRQPSNEEEDSTDNQTSSTRMLEKLCDLQEKLQVLIQQFNGLVQTIRQQQSTNAASNRRSRRRLLFLSQFIPIFSILAASLLNHMMNYTGSNSFPWWLVSAATVCSAFISTISMWILH